MQFPKVSVKSVGRAFAPIFERMTICSVAFGAMTFGAWVTMALTVSMPALTGGLDRMQLNFRSSTGS